MKLSEGDRFFLSVFWSIVAAAVLLCVVGLNWLIIITGCFFIACVVALLAVTVMKGFYLTYLWLFVKDKPKEEQR
jgi:hypothetical protein